MDRVKPNLLLFRKHLGEFIGKLSQAFPELFSDETAKDITTIKKVFESLEEEGEFEDMKMAKDFKRTETFRFAIRYLKNVMPFRDRFKKRDIGVFEDASFPDYVFPRLKIDLRDLLKLDESEKKDGIRMTLVYLSLLADYADKATEIFNLSEQARTRVQGRKQLRHYQRSELKKYIYNVIGAEGRNETMEKIINTILDEFETNYSHLIGSGNVNTDEVGQVITKLYNKLMDEYHRGRLKNNELKNSAKSLYKNLMSNDDVNLKDTFGEILNVLKMEEIPEERLQEMLQTGEIDKMMEDKGIDVQGVVKSIQEKMAAKMTEGTEGPEEPEDEDEV